MWSASGVGWIHFRGAPEIWGVVLWGRPTSAAIAALCESLPLELDAAPHASVVDARRVENAEPEAFKRLEEYVLQRQKQLAVAVTKLGLVRPPGMAGAIVAGFFEVLPRPYPVEVFLSLRDALAWAGAAAGLGDELEAAVARTIGVPELLVRLRAHLAETLADPTLPGAAKALAVSERTLQRRLTEAGTTWSDETALAKITAAKRLMLDTNEPLTSIALAVGCASLQHFGQVFRRLEKESPSAWRASHRK